MGKSSRVPSRTQGLFHLLRVADSYWLHEVLSSLLGVKTRSLGMVSVVFSSIMLLQDVTTHW
jgi:hypothetical protein